MTQIATCTTRRSTRQVEAVVRCGNRGTELLVRLRLRLVPLGSLT